MVQGYDSRRARTGIDGLTKPDPKDHAAQIVAWAICWPWNVAWTCCVYNPFRYIGEFLLREIQSTLFEISNGQFSQIERDLTLDPSPAPFPIRKTQHDQLPDVAELSQVMPEAPPDVGPELQKTLNGKDSETASAAAPSESSSLSQPDQTTDALPRTTLQPGPAKAIRPEQNDAVTAAGPRKLPRGNSSGSYSWTPPEPTPFVAMSEKPLRAVKYETGAIQPAGKAPTNKPDKPATDPWFEKHAPNR